MGVSAGKDYEQVLSASSGFTRGINSVKNVNLLSLLEHPVSVLAIIH